ncbi:hypothetical protein [Roseibium sp. SCP14]|uniref:hypothetical protein n=1 Tax=Roseibium sp. SCP14 TaxID=3141375 RepID=UPI0033381E11
MIAARNLESGELVQALDREVASAASYRMISLHPIGEHRRLEQFVDRLNQEMAA